MDIAAAVEFRLPLGQSHLLAYGNHGTLRASHGQTDVISVNRSRTTIQAFVVGIADKLEANICLVADLIHSTTQYVGVTIWYYRFSVFKQNRIDITRRRVVDTGDGFGTSSVRAQLRLVGKILKRIVMPEFHFHAPIQRPSLLCIIGCNRL